MMCDTPPLHMFPKIGFEAQKSPQRIKKPRTTQLKDFLRYIFMKYCSQGLNKPHFRLPCRMPKDYTWCGFYRFDSSSVVIMPFLKAPLVNNY